MFRFLLSHVYLDVVLIADCQNGMEIFSFFRFNWDRIYKPIVKEAGLMVINSFAFLFFPLCSPRSTRAESDILDQTERLAHFIVGRSTLHKRRTVRNIAHARLKYMDTAN